jgi:hypothetical protein
MATDTNAEVVETEARPTDRSGEVVESEAPPTDGNVEVLETEPPPVDKVAEVAETETRPDLLWDDQVRGLCVRVYRDGSKSFIFVYRIDHRQQFTRIGKTPVWSLEAARDRAKKLASILNQGDDPARYQKVNNVAPVENIIQYIAESLQTNQLRRHGAEHIKQRLPSCRR